MSKNNFGTKGGVQLAQYLAENCRIRILSIAQNGMGSQAGQVLGAALAVNTNLEQLNVGGNEFRKKGWKGVPSPLFCS